MKILVLKILSWWITFWSLSKNFGPFAKVVKIDLWCQLDAYRVLYFLVLTYLAFCNDLEKNGHTQEGIN